MTNLVRIVALLLALLFILACAEGEEVIPDAASPTKTPSTSESPSPSLSPSPQESPTPPSATMVYNSPPSYETPVQLTPGEYRLPYDWHSAFPAYQRARDEDAARPRFNGTVNGFRVYDALAAYEDPSLNQKECVAVRFDELSLLEFGYLPPGTNARTPQYAAKCADGETIWVLQEFGNLYASWGVSYELGEKAISTPYSGEYVKAISVAGHDGVAIGPVTEEGAGGSILVLNFAAGFLILQSGTLPFAELVAMAEGIKCGAC